jgi:hypothetical protein
MNKNAESWVRALRSYQYGQATGRLRKPGRVFWKRDSFCAMGVLYDLYLRSEARQWPKRITGPVPDAVLTWAGITRDLEREVVSHNDLGYSFRDLASIIEAKISRAERDLGRDRLWRDAGRAADHAIRKARQAAKHDAPVA